MSALKVSPKDLTQISRKNGGKFPEERVQQILKGESTVAAHGTQDMPMWGKVFNNMGNPTVTQGRLNSLLQFVEGMQAK